MRESLLISIVLLLNYNLISQCVPPSADNCEDAHVICSLNDLNGYSCHNADYANPTACSPICPSGGIANNTGWWAFVTEGGNICLTLTFSNCTVNNTGVQFGIWGDCDCIESIACDASCNGPGTRVICGKYEPCKTYYLFVDGCTGDVCDFSILTSSGSIPQLPKLGKISGSISQCKGACDVIYSIQFENDSTTCNPYWEWTLDGVALKGFNDSIKLDFEKEGTFTLCVTSIIGNPKSGTICDQEGPKCLAITVTKEKDRIGPPIYVCAENVPFIWFGQSISSSGEYRQTLKTLECCEYDTVVNVILLESPDPPTVYFLGCIGEKYIDPITKKEFTNCQNGTEVILPNSTNPHQCDSSYMLVAAFINGTGRLREYCQGGQILLEVSPIDRTCPDGGYLTESYFYTWYFKSDPSKKSIGSDEFIEVSKKDEYCVDIQFIGKLDKQSKSCTFTVCEQFNEDDFTYNQVCPKGEITLFVGDTGTYKVDTIFPADARFIWTISGGKLLTQDPQDEREIQVLWDFDPKPANQYQGLICYHMESSCPPTEDCCITVTVKVRSTSLTDLDQDNTWNIVPNPVSQSFKIIQQNNTKIKSVKLIDMSGKEIHEWKSSSKEYNIPNCPSGTYFVKIKTKSGDQIKKIAIER